MAEQPQSTDAALNSMITKLQDHPDKVLEILQQQVPLISKALDSEAAEYNNLVDLIEARDTTIDDLKEEVARLQQIITMSESTESPETSALRQQLEEANEALVSLAKDRENDIENLKQQITNHKSLSTSEIERLTNRLNGLQITETKLKEGLQATEKELKELRALNPKRLSKKNKELNKQISEQKESIKKLDASQAAAADELITKDKKIKTLVNVIKGLKQQVEEQRVRLDRHDGDISEIVFEGKNGLKAYIFDHCWGLTTSSVSEHVKTVNDYDWHLMVRTNLGIAVIVSVTDWLVSTNPLCEELKHNWPEHINDALEAIIIKRSKESHPHLVARREWAQNEGLENVPGLQEKHLQLLKESKFHSVYAVCHIPPERMVPMVKGMGLKTCETVHRLCRKHVHNWECDNWTREQRGLI